ncbi:MAG: SH3 domain-containing protein [Chloroflexota bacterium]
MSFPEEPQKPDALEPSEDADQNNPVEETFPEEPILPEGFTPIEEAARLTRARRRRARRMLVPPGADERDALLDNLARRAVPSFEFFLFALICGVVLGAAYLFDSPALLLVGALLAPILTPWVGLTLATQTGSWRFFFLTFGAMLVASALVFLGGWLAGMAGRFWQPLPLFHANIHSHLWLLDLFVVALGAMLLVISFIRSEQKPVVPSVMLAYGFFLPLSAAGLGLGIGAEHIWPDGILVFLVHLALAMLVGCIVLAILHFKPSRVIGYLLPLLISLVSLIALAIFTGLAAVIRDEILATRWIATPTPTSLALPSLTSATSSGTSTSSPIPSPSATPQPTNTFEPTPSYAMITSPEFGGANIRTEPGGGTLILTLLNGKMVQVLPEIEAVGSVIWVHIRIDDNTEGWVLQTVLTAATLTPTPTLTPIFTPTP